MATFKQKINESRVDAKREIEKIRNELKCQELFFEKKLNKIKLMAMSAQLDLESRQITQGIHKTRQIIDFLSSDLTIKSDRSQSRSRSRSRVSKKECGTNRLFSVDDVTNTERITHYDYSTSHCNSHMPTEEEPP